MIQAAQQQTAELKDKIKIVTNEIDILRQEAVHKDRELAVCRPINHSLY